MRPSYASARSAESPSWKVSPGKAASGLNDRVATFSTNSSAFSAKVCATRMWSTMANPASASTPAIRSRGNRAALPTGHASGKYR